MKFPSGIKKILNSKVLLYLVYFITAMNIFGYVNLNDFNSVALFTLVSYVTSFFNKNHVVILLTGILITNVLGNTQFMVVEGLTARKKKEGMDHEGEEEKEEEEPLEEEMVEDQEEDADIEEEEEDAFTGNGVAPVIDRTKSMEQQYKELDKIIGKDGIDAMTRDTQKLVKRQGKLAESMKAMGPLLENVTGMLKGFDNEQFEGIQKTLKSLKEKKI
jgi:hypothetical protein